MRLPLLELIQTGGLPRTDPRPCPYLPDRDAISEGFTTPGLHAETYHDLMDLGFRRSGNIFYRPRCQGCRLCVPMRIHVDDFRPSKSQRRVQRMNSDVKLLTALPHLTAEKLAIYQRYLAHQHPGSPQNEDEQSLREFLYQDVVDTLEVTYSIGRRVIGVSILDVCSRSVSSVYHYFDPDERHRSLGTFSLLAEIQLTRQWGVPYYYLGYWVEGSATMDYKSRFRPHELMIDGQWRKVENL
jgi:arginine-tRNA-protein transferase